MTVPSASPWIPLLHSRKCISYSTKLFFCSEPYFQWVSKDDKLTLESVTKTSCCLQNSPLSWEINCQMYNCNILGVTDSNVNCFGVKAMDIH